MMFLKLLVSLCCVVPSGDTLDVATVSVQRNAAAASLSPVQTISEAEISRLGTIGLHEAVKHFSGVSIKDYGGIGGLKTVSVRNMGASHTAIIYDGIAISDAQNGQVDISRFDLDDIKSVSISIGQEDDIFCGARHILCIQPDIKMKCIVFIAVIHCNSKELPFLCTGGQVPTLQGLHQNPWPGYRCQLPIRHQFECQCCIIKGKHYLEFILIK